MQLVLGVSFNAAVLMEAYCVLFLNILIIKNISAAKTIFSKKCVLHWVCVGLLLRWRMAVPYSMLLGWQSPFTSVLIFFGFVALYIQFMEIYFYICLSSKRAMGCLANVFPYGVLFILFLCLFLPFLEQLYCNHPSLCLGEWNRAKLHCLGGVTLWVPQIYLPAHFNAEPKRDLL